jgi:hypothetical protein
MESADSEQWRLEQLTCATSAAKEARMSPGSLLPDGPAPGEPFLQDTQALQLSHTGAVCTDDQSSPQQQTQRAEACSRQ